MPALETLTTESDLSSGWKSSFLSDLITGLKGDQVDVVEPLFPGYENEPVRFVEQLILPYFPKVEIRPYQADILEAIAELPRVAVRKGNGVGATTAAVWADLWFLCSRPLSKVITTAGTGRQVKDIFWAEMHKWGKRSLPIASRIIMNTMECRIRGHEKTWFSLGFTAKERADNIESGTAEGWHADSLLYIIDEGKAVPDAIYREATGSMTGEEAKLLVLSVPGGIEGQFYRIFSRLRTSWKCFHIPAAKKKYIDDDDKLEHGRDEKGRYRYVPNSKLVSQESIDEKLEDGEDSQLFQNRALGEFSAKTEHGLIKLPWIEAAIERWKANKDMKPTGKRRVGCDVGAGGDCSAMAPRIGMRVLPLTIYRGEDTMEMLGILRKECRKIKAKGIIEDVGVGWSVMTRARELGYNMAPFKPGAKPQDKKKFANLRAESWWRIRMLFKKRLIEIPDDQELIEELLAIKYKILSEEKYIIWPKEKIIKALKRSTNKADAVMIAFSRPTAQLGLA